MLLNYPPKKLLLGFLIIWCIWGLANISQPPIGGAAAARRALIGRIQSSGQLRGSTQINVREALSFLI